MEKVIESLMVPVEKHLGYVVSSTHYFGEMGARMNELDDKRVETESHMEENRINRREIPPNVPGWLEEVKAIRTEVEKISIGVNGFFNMRKRYKAGKESSKILEKIDCLIKKKNETMWTNREIPLGDFDSKKASTSGPSHGSTQNKFKSRDLIFEGALKSLQPDNHTQMIALCGMAGVGKTTLMEQLKKEVEDRKMFDWVVKATIGQKTDPLDFQTAIADHVGGQPLTEITKARRADRLHERFCEMSQDGKKKILVVLDDVWEMFDLKDIGLSPLPNQGVGFKLLLTSQDENVCTRLGVETNSIFKVDCLTNPEAQNFFWQFAQPSHRSDPELNQIGENIIRKCGGLPIALKTIATTLSNIKSKDEWKDALFRLKHHNLMQDQYYQNHKMSYKKEFEHLKFHLEAIKLATNYFHDNNYISRGGFGKVYKGKLVHFGRPIMVAVKRLDPTLGQGTPEFWKEIMMLSRYRHENIVSLLGFCEEDDENILVYEYLSNKSLDLYLGSSNLSWIQRLNICIGAARGLEFLHNPNGTMQRVLHRDIKSSNILLDENWNAKISDFGLSKLGPANQEFTFLMSHPLGTKGYCDPLYVKTALLAKETDVYSFGVVLFEVLCGRLCIESNDGARPYLPTLAQSCYKEKKIGTIVHNCLQDQISQDCLDKFSEIAYQCLREDYKERPPVAKIVKQLQIALGYQEEYNYEMENKLKAQAEPLTLLVQLSEEELNA